MQKDHSLEAKQQALHQVLDQMLGKRALIIGDVMIDRYLVGGVHRISPEAPVPILQFEREEHRLGGAANVALNIKALGGHAVLCSLVGEDSFGTVFFDLLRQMSLPTTGIITSLTRPTTVKTRIIGNGQQMLRIDREEATEINERETSDLYQRIEQIIANEQPDVIIFEDYDKGVLSDALIKQVIDLARAKGILTTVDPKKRNFFSYQNATLFKPNLKEIRDSLPFEVKAESQDLHKACQYIRQKLANQYTLVTLSEKGVYLESNGVGQLHGTISRQVADVSGAGDTVISVASLALVVTQDLTFIATLANLAGGQVCELPGVVPVNLDALRKEINLVQ
jgi:D-glycero-beta-D-manno-heptose-7-phosphate kinase